MDYDRQDAKADAGKCKWHVLGQFFPELEQAAAVREQGIEQYGEYGWTDVEPFFNRYMDAIERHWVARMNGEIIDKKSGYDHLAHIICNCLFIMHKMRRDKECEEAINAGTTEA